MDTFMDKLAQKLTAQEMIKANAAADAAELSRFREQAAEYEALFQRIKDESGGNASLMEQSAARIEQSTAKAEASAQKVEQSAAKVEQGAARVEEGAAKVEQSAQRVEQASARTEELIAAAAAKIEELQASGQDTEQWTALLEEMKKLQAERHDHLADHVHKECVKVYRNVQAVISDEMEKYNGTAGKNISSVSGRMGAVLGISIVALLVSAAGLAFQILVYLHII